MPQQRQYRHLGYSNTITTREFTTALEVPYICIVSSPVKHISVDVQRVACDPYKSNKAFFLQFLERRNGFIYNL